MDILAQSDRVIFHTYKRTPLEVKSGEGVYLIAANGERYLDMVAGIGVNVLGYHHPRLEAALVEQIQKYIHLSNYYVQQSQIELARRLCSLTGFGKVFFSNSGTEANEGAMKLVRLWGSKKGKSEVFGLTNSFHGRTFGALSLMDRPNYRDGFGPFVPETGILPYNEPDALEGRLSEKTAAVFIECIQGEGGIVLVRQEFVDKLKQLRAKFGFLIVADEIQSGIGRTGKFCAYEHYRLEPDIVTLAKPLGGGIPLGAILANDELADIIQPGMHGTTFGGNPVACAGGVAVIEELSHNKLLDRVRAKGDYFLEELGKLREKFSEKIAEVRGKGLMVACELAFDGADVVSEMRKRHVLVNLTQGKVLRFLPPYIIEKDQIEECIEKFREVLGGK